MSATTDLVSAVMPTVNRAYCLAPMLRRIKRLSLSAQA
jgi:hypothetical protein